MSYMPTKKLADRDLHSREPPSLEHSDYQIRPQQAAVQPHVSKIKYIPPSQSLIKTLQETMQDEIRRVENWRSEANNPHSRYDRELARSFAIDNEMRRGQTESMLRQAQQGLYKCMGCEYTSQDSFSRCPKCGST